MLFRSAQSEPLSNPSSPPRPPSATTFLPSCSKPKSSQTPTLQIAQLGDPGGSARSRDAGSTGARRGGGQAAVAARPSAAAGVSAMITRSKLVEQLRDYQIRSQHKRDIIGAISWGLLCCLLIVSSYMMLYFRHFWLSAVIISVGILLPAGLYILRQRKLAKKRERRLLLPLSM